MNENIGNVCIIQDDRSETVTFDDVNRYKRIIEEIDEQGCVNLEKLLQKDPDFFNLKNFSSMRKNILSFMEFDSSMEVLELGSGCGILTSELCQLVKSVVSIDFNLDCCRINALRNKTTENLVIFAGNYKNILTDVNRKFDVILLIGTLEENQQYNCENNFLSSYLEAIRPRLRQNGKVYIAIDNKLGVRYFSGGKRMIDDKYFENIDLECSWRLTKSDIKTIIVQNGFLIKKWVYPYPDYLFPREFYTDIHLPKQGEFSEESVDYESNHIKLFNEKKLYDCLIDNNVYDVFANSFLLEIGVN